MNKTYLFIFLIFIILFCLFTQICFTNIKEAFIPKKIKEYYRPFARNMRIGYEGFYDKSSLDFSNLFRKFEII